MNTFDYLCYKCGLISKIEYGTKPSCSKCIKYDRHERLSLESIAKYNQRLKDMEDKGI